MYLEFFKFAEAGKDFFTVRFFFFGLHFDNFIQYFYANVITEIILYHMPF